MQFTSLAYLGFFAAVFAVHWAVPQKARWAVCLAASAGFYALLGAPMLAVLALCIAVSYLGGLWLQRRRGRRPALALAAAAALAPLLFFKYFNTRMYPKACARSACSRPSASVFSRSKLWRIWPRCTRALCLPAAISDGTRCMFHSFPK